MSPSRRNSTVRNNTLTKWQVRVNAKIRRRPSGNGEIEMLAEVFALRGCRSETLYRDLLLSISPGQIVAVTGPSGSGKSVLLDYVAKKIKGSRRLRVRRLSRSNKPAVSILRGGPLSQRLELLSRCGLAEAMVLVTPARLLSGGQLYRLALAESLHAARRANSPRLVIADEFAACLDTDTAEVLCRQIRKLISASKLAMLLATPRAEMLSVLRPDYVLVKPLSEPARLCRLRPRRPGRRDPRRWPIVRGSIRDYRALAGFHYVAGPPAAHKRVYAIYPPALAVGGGIDARPSVAAVLVVSPPLANCRGRNLATDNRYAGKNRALAMRRLNREVEAISRVIVHPTYRGCGLAVRLVRHAIAHARTPYVEALAAMGAVHPFFEKAGMTCHGRVQGASVRYSYYLADSGRAGRGKRKQDA